MSAPIYRYNAFTNNFDLTEVGGGGGGSITVIADSGPQLVSEVIPVSSLNPNTPKIIETVIQSNILNVQNNAWASAYVVDPSTAQGLKGTFSTIQSAIDAVEADGVATANVFGTIIIRNAPFGTYIENLTFPTGIRVHLKGLIPAMIQGPQAGAFIQGGHVIPSGSTVLFENLGLDNALDPLFDNSGEINLFNCFTSGVSGSGFVSAYNCVMQNVQCSGMLECYSCDFSTPVDHTLTDCTSTMVDCLGSGPSFSMTLNGSTSVNFTNCTNLKLIGDAGGDMNFSNCTVTDYPNFPFALFTYNQLSAAPNSFPSSFIYPENGFLSASTAGNVFKYSIATMSTSINRDNQFVGVNASGALTVNIDPFFMTANTYQYIADIAGNASSNTITIHPTSGTINGGSNVQITGDYGWAMIFFDGTNFFAFMGSGGGGIATPISIANGGTNASLYAANGIVNYNGTEFETVSGTSLDSSGIYTNTNQPLALVGKVADSAGLTGSGTLINPVLFDFIYTDQTPSYDASTGIFTAPAQGYYSFDVQVGYGGVLPTNTSGELRVNSNSFVTRRFFNAANCCDSNGIYCESISGIGFMQVGDEFSVLTSVSGNPTDNISILGGNFGDFTILQITKIA